jgi:hypothetical protein
MLNLDSLRFSYFVEFISRDLYPLRADGGQQDKDRSLELTNSALVMVTSYLASTLKEYIKKREM